MEIGTANGDALSQQFTDVQIAEVTSGVADVVRQVTQVEGLELAADSDLLDVPNFSSASLVQLLADIEERFGVEFTDDDMEMDDVLRFGPLCEIVTRLVAASAASRAGGNRHA